MSYCVIRCYYHDDNCRGQVMNAEMLSNTVDVELICDHMKYSLTVSRASPHTYAIFMNNSCLEVDLHRYVCYCLYLVILIAMVQVK